MSNNKPQLLYFGDPMCSWCYGFANEISKAVEDLSHLTDFDIIMGGLRPYNTQSIVSIADFLREHWDHISEKTGQLFKYDILKDASFAYDTEPACRAVVTMRHLQPGLAFDFFKRVQTAFYAENKNTGKASTYNEIAVELGVDPIEFESTFLSEAMKKAVMIDFELTASLGVSGFPTLILKQGEKHALVTNGYTNAAYVVNRVKYHLGLH